MRPSQASRRRTTRGKKSAALSESPGDRLFSHCFENTFGASRLQRRHAHSRAPALFMRAERAIFSGGSALQPCRPRHRAICNRLLFMFQLAARVAPKDPPPPAHPLCMRFHAGQAGNACAGGCDPAHCFQLYLYYFPGYCSRFSTRSHVNPTFIARNT